MRLNARNGEEKREWNRWLDGDSDRQLGDRILEL
jgi:hypothetical protein